MKECDGVILDCTRGHLLDRHLHVDLRIWIVILDDKIIVYKVLDLLNLSLELERRKGARRSLELLLQRLHVIGIYVSVAQCVDKIPWLEIRHMCNHISQESVAGNVEWNAQTHVGRSLIHLAG